MIMKKAWKALLSRNADIDDYKDSQNIQCDKGNRKWKKGPEVMHALRKARIKNGLTGNVAFDDEGYRKDFVLLLFEVAFSKGLTQFGFWTPKVETKNGKIKGGLAIRQPDEKERSLYQQTTKDTRIISNKKRKVTSILVSYSFYFVYFFYIIFFSQLIKFRISKRVLFFFFEHKYSLQFISIYLIIFF